MDKIFLDSLYYYIFESMKIIKSKIFRQFPEIIFGFSTKEGLHRLDPYYFNLSYTVGDNKVRVAENRKYFFDHLGIPEEKTSFQKQIHSDIVKFVESPGMQGESDALITNKPNMGLAITSADCAAIFIYDRDKKVIAAVHAGWRGSANKILKKTLNILKDDFKSVPVDLFVYLGPAISQKYYQVGKEVAVQFNKKYLSRSFFKRFLDIKKINHDFLIEFGIPEEQIEISNLCSYEQIDLFHSYRRDGIKSGRSLGIIALKGE